jgi:hypothetical protein
VDDSERHMAAWQQAGGIYILHRSAKESLAALAEIYPSVRMPV